MKISLRGHFNLDRFDGQNMCFQSLRIYCAYQNLSFCVNLRSRNAVCIPKVV